MNGTLLSQETDRGVWLALLVIALVLVIALNPQRRTQLSRIEKSRVGILLDIWAIQL